MKIAFLTESPLNGRYPSIFSNARTEIAWMIALEADHFNILQFENIKNYDWVFVIFPKGGTNLNCDGHELIKKDNRFSFLYELPFVEKLKENNKKVAFIQEGPVWYPNDFSIKDQFNFYNQLSEVDVIFSHNSVDKQWYEGWFPSKPVYVMPTLIIEDTVKNIIPSTEEKVIIGGSFCRWYGGFQSYLVASEYGCPIYVPSMHAKRENEELVPNLTHLPYLQWSDWMKHLSTFKYAVHMMPTIAAGTFSLNCAYFGIPCIGNIRVDTQRDCFPDISVDPEDVKQAISFSKALKNQPEFYDFVSNLSKKRYEQKYSIFKFKETLNKILS